MCICNVSHEYTVFNYTTFISFYMTTCLGIIASIRFPVELLKKYILSNKAVSKVMNNYNIKTVAK